MPSPPKVEPDPQQCSFSFALADNPQFTLVDGRFRSWRIDYCMKAHLKAASRAYATCQAAAHRESYASQIALVLQPGLFNISGLSQEK
jgi:hypothetical protein